MGQVAPFFVLVMFAAVLALAHGATYNLEYGEWGTCSVPCGDGGTQSRTVAGLSPILLTSHWGPDMSRHNAVRGPLATPLIMTNFRHPEVQSAMLVRFDTHGV